MSPKSFQTFLLLVALLVTAFPAFAEIDVTFFITTDNHYGVDAQGDEMIPANQATVDAMNAAPGIAYPAAVGGTVDAPRGVVVTGDLTEASRQEEWDWFTADYGVDGEGRLNYPVYEGWGNHDQNGNLTPVTEGIKARNTERPAVVGISENGYHYSWDWGGIHLVMLNEYAGTGTGDPSSWGAPLDSLPFLIDDLAEQIGDSDKPVILFMHFALDGWGLANWTTAEQDAFYDAILPYSDNILAVFGGHGHTSLQGEWRGFQYYEVAAAQPEEGNKGFTVVNVTNERMVVATRQIASDTWGDVFTKTFALADPAADATFFAVSDVHFGYSQASTFNQANAERMNALPGTDWPGTLGGTVGTPEAVVLPGDLTQSDTADELAAYESVYGFDGDAVLNWPVYPSWGNHDGNRVRTRLIEVNAGRTYLNESANGLHYSFNMGGVHCVMAGIWPGDERSDGLFNYDPFDSLTFLTEDLAAYAADGTPVVIFQHFGFGSHSLSPDYWWTDAEAAVYYDAIKDYNVVAIVHGHEHDHFFSTWNGIDIVNLPHADDGEVTHGFAAFRVLDDEFSASFYTASGWEGELHKVVKLGPWFDGPADGPGEPEPEPETPQALVRLDASELTPGTLSSWTNEGTLGGTFGPDGTTPTVADVAGRRAVTFDGSDRMLSDVLAPAELGGNGSFSIIVQGYNPAVAGNENMVAWCDRGVSPGEGEYATFGWGTNTSEGAALYRYGQDLAYNNVPPAGAWKHLTLVYDAEAMGKVTVFIDGDADSSVTLGSMNRQSGKPIMIGAMQWTTHTPEWFNPFSGSLAEVVVYDDALTTEQIQDHMLGLPPTPDPAEFDAPPAAAGASSISMTAAVCRDVDAPVEYYFAETSGNPGGSDSGWIEEREYVDDGLQPDTEYVYTVKARDAKGHETAAAPPAAATTGSVVAKASDAWQLF